MRVLTERVVHFSFGDIVWPPLVWSLVPCDVAPRSDGLGPQITEHLADSSGWLRYGPERTNTDLRELLRVFPALPHPMLARTDDWVEFSTTDGTDADAVVVFGRRR